MSVRRSGRGGKFSTNALLQKVNSQLRGETLQGRNQLEDDEDDLNAYLSTISKKKTAAPAQPQWDKFGEDSDLSVSDDNILKPTSPTTNAKVSSGNKFLKKKSAPVQDSEYHVPISQQSQSYSSIGQHGQGHKTQAGVLGKVAMYSNKYSTQTQASKRISSQLSDSDYDMNLSTDEEVVADVQRWKKKSVPAKTAPNYTVADSDDSSSMNIGRGGGKFLKKKPAAHLQEETSRQKKVIKEKIAKKVKAVPSALSTKSSPRRVMLDTDEESLADFIGGLSGSSSSRTSRESSPRAPTIPRGVHRSPRTSLSPRTQHSVGLDEIKEEDHEHVYMTPNDESSDNDIKLNIMDLDDLEPAVILVDSKPQRKTTSLAKKTGISSKRTQSRGIKDTKTDSSEDLFGLMGLQTVDDLLGGADELSVASEVQTAGVTSEIRTEPDDSDYERATTPLKSILATPRSPKATPRSARGRVRYSIDDDVRFRSRSPSPEVISTARVSATASVVHTEASSVIEEISTARTIPELNMDETDTDTYTEEYSEDFSSQSSRSIPERTPRSRYSRQDSDNYSDNYTSATDVDETSRASRVYSRSSSRESYSDDYTSFTESSRSRTPSPDRRPKKLRTTRNCEVQTGLDMGLMYHWNTRTAASAVLGPQYGMAFVDPTPIATHVVSADALEAMTGYSPSVIALNDLLRQQLALTTQFMDMQKRLHSTYTDMVQPDFQYTTLEDTKKYIKKHKRPTITFEEALKQVKAEMGLK